MGQDQSKDDGSSPQFRTNPKFQKARTRNQGPSLIHIPSSSRLIDDANISASAPERVQLPSANSGDRKSQCSISSPIESTSSDPLSSSSRQNYSTSGSFSTSKDIDQQSTANIGDSWSSSSALSHNLTLNPRNDVLFSKSESNNANESVGLSSTQNSTLSDNEALQTNQYFDQTNHTKEIGSLKAKQSLMENDMSPSKAVNVNTFPTPMRDVRHVPTYNERIKLNSTSAGNPFLTDNIDPKPEDRSNLQMSSKINVYPKTKKSIIEDKLDEMYRSGVIEIRDLDKCALETLDKLPLDDALYVLNQFIESNPKTKSNKSAYLCSMIKYRLSGKNLGINEVISQIQEPIESSPTKSMISTLSSTGACHLESDNTSKLKKSVIKEKLEQMYKSGVIENSDLDKRALESLDRLPLDDALDILNKFVRSNPKTKSNKSAYLCSMIKSKMNGQKLDTNKLIDEIEEPRESVTQKSMFSTPSSTSLGPSEYFDPDGKRDKVTEIETKLISHSFSVPEVSEENLSSFKESPFSNDESLYFKNITTNESKGQKIEKREPVNRKGSKIGPTILEQRKFKRKNITCNNTLRNVEKIAESLCTFKLDSQIKDTNDFKINKSTNIIDSKYKSEKISFEDCTTQMKNVEFLSQETNTLPILQQSICENLATINSFMLGLKSFPYMTEEIVTQINVLKENISSLSIGIEALSAALVNDDNPSTNPDKPQYSHQEMSKTAFPANSLQQLNMIEKDHFKYTSPMVLKKQNKEIHVLGKNHNDMLDIICSSSENKYTFGKTYFCIPCDFWNVDKKLATSHVYQHQIENGKWHSCDSCGIDFYGTDDHFESHCLSVQHINILKLKNKEITQPNELEEEKDDVSVCSSSGGRIKPHEILLRIAKDCQNKNQKNHLVGLFCQVCNRYFRQHSYKGDIGKHIKEHPNINKNRYKLFNCVTCNVQLFGSMSLWQEHENMELHNELASKDTTGETNVQRINSEFGSQMLSNVEGPHFELMKEVLKRRVMNDVSNDTIGLYCHVCKTYTVDDKQRRTHVSSASHSNCINSPGRVNKETWHYCPVCNIHLICDDHIFTLHEKTLAHEAVLNLQRSKTDKKEGSTDTDEASSNESEDIEDENEEENSDNQSMSNTSQNEKLENTKKNIIGIQVTGLNSSICKKDVFDTFKNFGFLSTWDIHNNGKTARISFKTIESTQLALDQKDLYIKGTKIGIHPIFESRRGKRAKRVVEMMNPSVMEALNNHSNLDRLVKILKGEIAEVRGYMEDRRAVIEQDIHRAIPGCKVHVFGSQFTGLATRDSDFDIYIDYDGRSYFSELHQKEQEFIIHKLLDKFTEPRSGFRVCTSVLEARVPILRVVHLKTGIPCDISCRSGLSMENSILTRHLLSVDFRAHWLVITIKWWMRANDLLSSSQFTSYTTIWLVLFFLMYRHPRVLQSISDMKEGCPPYSIGYWDCRFNRNSSTSKLLTAPYDSHFKLLAEFFKFYGTFNFRNVVMCPLTATCISKKDFDELKLPPVFRQYLYKIKNNHDAERLRTTTPICLQDPFDLSHNIAKGVSRKDLNKFKRFCHLSVKVYTKNQRFN